MKKIKLFTTIASLCLAVALMAFGVYAATSASFGVTSNIKFTVDGNIGGTLTVKSYMLASKDAEIASDTVLETFTATINATDASGSVNAVKGEKETATFNTTHKFVVYVISFEETTDENVNLQVVTDNIALKKGSITLTDKNSIKVASNELNTASTAKDKTYRIAIELVEALNATTEFTVEFNVLVTIPA